jgi:RNA polymerase sigma factor (TIGR02999 family)
MDKPGVGDLSDPVASALAELRGGDEGALDRLVPLMYEDLRRLAHQRLRLERDGHTLGTTALVHEAYLRLANQRQLRPSDRSEFFAVASNIMRRVLVDYARARRRQKRGANEQPVPLDQAPPLLSDAAIAETLALDVALDKLEATQPRAARVFEQRLFGGLSIDEISEVLSVSPKTVQRDWHAARAWVLKEIGHDADPAQRHSQ